MGCAASANKTLAPSKKIKHRDSSDFESSSENEENTNLTSARGIIQTTPKVTLSRNMKVLYSNSRTELSTDRLEQMRNITCYKCLKRFNLKSRMPILHSCCKEVTCLPCWESAFSERTGRFKCVYKCKKFNKYKKSDPPKLCPRTKRLVEYLPLDTELTCEKHEK